MNKSITNRNLTVINFAIVSYFMLLVLINYYKIDHVLVGVFRELLTIPFFLAQIVFLVIGIKHLLTNKKDYVLIISLIALAICTINTLGWFL